MRAAFALLLLAAVLPGCTPYIPLKDDFSTSALAPAGQIPPEFAEFNNYNPAVNPLLAEQVCATPYQPIEAKNLGASTGVVVEARGRCREHIPFFGP